MLIIDPCAKLKCVLPDKHRSNTWTIEELFNYISQMSAEKMTDQNMIRLPDIQEKLDVSDGLGYTKVLSLNRYSYNGRMKTIFAGGFHVTVGDHSLIPVFDMTIPEIIGFHGEAKRVYKCKNPDRINQDDYIRVYDKYEKIYKYVPIDDISETARLFEYGYEITTSAGTCLINSISIYTSEFVDISKIS